MNRRPLILLLALTSLLSGCLIGSSSRTQTVGRRVSAESLEQIQPGDPKSEAVALFGEPTGSTGLEDGGELLSWTYRRTRESRSSLFLVFASTREDVEEEGTVYVRTDAEGRVAKIWRD